MKNLIADIKIEEGFRGDPYKDHIGYLTIGYGTKLPLTEEEAELLLKHRLEKMQKELNRRIKEVYGEVSIPAKAWDILYNMAYQLGVGGLLKFKKMLKALEKQDYETAAKEGLDSLWARQTPNRARRLMDRLREVGNKD